MRPLRDVAKATTDESIIESLIFKKIDQEINIILLPYPKPTQVRR